MIVYISDRKNSTRELLNLINSFSEVAEYKIKTPVLKISNVIIGSVEIHCLGKHNV